MPRSMTGFGRAILNLPFGRFTVEIYSVNRKYLEISVSMPREFGQFEQEVRKWATDQISRGQVSIRIYFASNTLKASLPDAKNLKTLKEEWNHLALSSGIDPKEVTLSFLVPYLPTAPFDATDEEQKGLKQCVQEALSALLVMKETEGKALVDDLLARLQELKRMIQEIEKQSPEQSEKMKAKLFDKMGEVLKTAPEFEERLLREVALFAEKVDIAEEITRFHSHIEQFKKLCKGTVAGRALDFLLQEMGREINTIGSKASDANISHLVVAMKSELEKIREQVQNIE